MDELMEMFDSFIGDALLLETAMEDEFKVFEKKLNDCVSQANERGTPVQSKKRPKRQASISEKDESISSRNDSEEAAGAQHSDKSVASVNGRSSARKLDVYDAPTNASVADVQQPMDTVPSNDTSVRPSRTARLKAQEKLKEPSLATKLRNDSHTAVMVKTERDSFAADSAKKSVGRNVRISKDKDGEMETENDPNLSNRSAHTATHLRKDEGFGSRNESSEKDESAVVTGKAASREASLMVIPLPIPKVEVLSDEEMPPPKMPPPKTAAPKVRTKKKVLPKSEKLADESASSSAVSSAESSINSSTSSTSSSTASGRRPRGRPPKASKVAEPKDAPMEEESVEPIRIKTEKLSLVQTHQQHSGNDKVTRSSDKSIYEDAQEQMHAIQQEPEIRPLKVVLEKITTSTENKSLTSIMNGTYITAQQPVNTTYDVPPSIQNSTFTVNSPPSTAPCNETFNIPTPESFEQLQAGISNDMFALGKTGSTGKSQPSANMAKNLANASIMTEDDSVVENSPNQAPLVKAPAIATEVTVPATNGKKPSASTAGALKKVPSSSGYGSSSATSARQAQSKNNKELFNPCIMSPIKSRIQAFEKCATTGTLTKATTTIGTPQARVGRVLKTISTPSLATTPQFSSLESLGTTHSAHAKETIFTPNCAALPVTKASSASKIHQMQSRALQSKFGGNAAGGSTSNLLCESSWDRALGTGSGNGGTLSNASSTSSLLDEKKKKREEKQRLAALHREAIEREKREHAERMLREKEEKHRKLLHEKQEKIRIEASKKAKKQEEFEKRRQMEEQRALADQKRDELAKQLEQQRIDRELLETLKQSQMKETQETKLHKQLYQQKLRQKQEQQQMAVKKKATASNKELFTFEMIDTDDTTDDDEAEDTAARKKKRPPPPEWCRNTAEFRKTLTIQAQIDTKVIDKLFSVQPMTPDLRILFPSIDAHKLKRNSSAIWRTPPRYSQLP